MEEEISGCICQTSIYIYSMQHNIICYNKEEKNTGEDIAQDVRMKKKFEAIHPLKVGR